MAEKLNAQITFRLSERLYEALQLIGKKQRRKPTEVARALLERGFAAFSRDGILFEEDPIEEFVQGLLDDAKSLAARDQLAESVKAKRRGAFTAVSEGKEGRKFPAASAITEGTKKGGKKRA